MDDIAKAAAGTVMVTAVSIGSVIGLGEAGAYMGEMCDRMDQHKNGFDLVCYTAYSMTLSLAYGAACGTVAGTFVLTAPVSVPLYWAYLKR